MKIIEIDATKMISGTTRVIGEAPKHKCFNGKMAIDTLKYMEGFELGDKVSIYGEEEVCGRYISHFLIMDKLSIAIEEVA
jgi:hypothetical protein